MKRHITNMKKKRRKPSKQKSPYSNIDERNDYYFDKIEMIMRTTTIFLDKNFCEPVIASMIGTNRNYVSSAVKSHLEIGFCDYVNKYRIAFASKYISDNPDVKLSEVSDMCGYSSKSTFTNAFKKEMGIDPKDWLVQCRVRRSTNKRTLPDPDKR